MYPWAIEILSSDNYRDSYTRIDWLSEKAIETMTQVAGNTHASLNRAFIKLFYNADEIIHHLLTKNLSDAFNELKLIFPEKMDVIGSYNFDNMVTFGIEKANQYGLRGENCQLVYLLFMFLAGSGFDTDPQFSFAGKILKDYSLNESIKVDLLFRQGMKNLRHFLSKA
jgi:hypothetical protein